MSFITICIILLPPIMMGDLKENFVEFIDAVREPYFGNLDTLRSVNIDLIRDKIKKSAFLTSKTGLPYYLRCVVSDRDNLDQIKKIEKAALLEISPNLSTISQYGNLVSDSGKEEQLELIIKGIRGGELIRKACSGKESLLPLIWYDNLFLLLNGPFVQINDLEKAKILKIISSPSTMI